ncbi:MAG TPA: 50S ribosomal protein L25 [Clostridia bacterium]|nr:50S ribosomal protein L25 [Clostridia bacterium]
MATATQTNLVEAKPREASDKNAARRLRTTGLIPGVLYGAGKDSRSIAIDPKAINKILHSESGHNTIFDVVLDGEQTKAMVVEWQSDPLKGSLLHVDLKRIAMDKKMRVQVPVQIIGEAPGVKTQGGILDVVMREVEVECLPADIPSHIDVDVSNLMFGEPVRVADLPKSDKIKYLSDEDLTIVHVTSVKEEAAPSADAAATEAAAGPAEPEVIKKGKQETEADEKADKGKK